MLLIGLYLAGLFLVVKDGVPWVLAVTSGTIRTRSSKRELVMREQEPGRFTDLVRQRFSGMAPGALCLILALAWTFWPVVGAISVRG